MDALTTFRDVSQQDEDALVKDHALLVKRIAHHLLGKLPHSVQVEDLIQAGMLGLLEAARHYDASKGASFETYAGIRIRGYMLDEVRSNDWVPRSVYKNARTIAKAVKEVENTLGRTAKDTEIAATLQISLKEYQQMLQDSAGGHIYGFEDLGVTEDVLKSETGGGSSEPQACVLHHDLLQRLSQVIAGLPSREKLVLSLYYEQDLNLKEIGEVLEVSESRISQILTQATHRIRARLPE